MMIGNDREIHCEHAYRRRTKNQSGWAEQCAKCGMGDRDMRVDDWLVGFLEVLSHPQGREQFASLMIRLGQSVKENSGDPVPQQWQPRIISDNPVKGSSNGDPVS